MINWREMKDLHVISKIEELLHKWYQLELIWVDQNGKITSAQKNTDFVGESEFFKLQMSLEYGIGYLEQDIENIGNEFKNSEKIQIEFQTCFSHIKGMATKLIIDGEYHGQIIAYPYCYYDLTQLQIDQLMSQLVDNGVDINIATTTFNNIKKMGPRDIAYFKDLMQLIGSEITGFYQEINQREQRIQDLNSELGERFRYHTMIGKSKEMQKIYNLLDKISKSNSSIFIQGSNGTGKELVAKAIHYYSPRKNNLFLAVNCSAFNENLLDSELFGHAKGAFTGAIKEKKGLFEQANGGTLFLDEIGDTSLSMQVKLLRILQEGTYLPVGATVSKKCNVRIIAATNKPIVKMMKDGSFREDLYYRINVINVKLPDLKDRKEDLSLLIDTFLKRRCDNSGLPMKTFSKKCLEFLYDYNWPGNVRELENEIERLVVLSGEDKVIVPDSLSPRILDYYALNPKSKDVSDVNYSQERSSNVANQLGIDTNGSLKIALEELEAIMISQGLKRCQNNKSKLAKELGISRASLIMKVEKYHLGIKKQVVNE